MTIELASDSIISISSLNLIGITGHAGVGKDTAAIYLCENYDRTYSHAFAQPLKRACAEAFGIPYAEFQDRDQKEIDNPYWGVSPRKIAQFVGTEFFRHHIQELISDGYSAIFWIERLEGRLTGELPCPEDEGAYEKGDTVVITDVRFQNEYDWVTDNSGKVLHLRRSGYEGNIGISGHASEIPVSATSLDVSWFINNDSTLEDLYAQLDKFAEFCGLTKKDDPFPL